MKYLFCYTYQTVNFGINGIAHGDAIAKVPDYLTEAALTNVRAGLARQHGLSDINQVCFTSVVQLAA